MRTKTSKYIWKRMLTGSIPGGSSPLETQLFDDETGPDKSTRDNSEKKPFEVVFKRRRSGCFWGHQRRGHGSLVGPILIWVVRWKKYTETCQESWMCRSWRKVAMEVTWTAQQKWKLFTCQSKGRVSKLRLRIYTFAWFREEERIE